jgi:cold shock CspA family protein
MAYHGIIKSKTDNYAFIICDEIKKEHKRDVFIAPRSVPDRIYHELDQGHEVTFDITFEGGAPQAKNLTITGKADVGVLASHRVCRFWKQGGCNKADCPYTHELADFNTATRPPRRKADQPKAPEEKPPPANDYWGQQQWRKKQLDDTWSFPQVPKWMPKDAKAVHLHGQPGWFVPAPPEALEKELAPQPIVQRQVVVVQQRIMPVAQQPVSAPQQGDPQAWGQGAEGWAGHWPAQPPGPQWPAESQSQQWPAQDQSQQWPAQDQSQQWTEQQWPKETDGDAADPSSAPPQQWDGQNSEAVPDQQWQSETTAPFPAPENPKAAPENPKKQTGPIRGWDGEKWVWV